jgi:hypothetical protein
VTRSGCVAVDNSLPTRPSHAEALAPFGPNRNVRPFDREEWSGVRVRWALERGGLKGEPLPFTSPAPTPLERFTS